MFHRQRIATRSLKMGGVWTDRNDKIKDIFRVMKLSSVDKRFLLENHRLYGWMEGTRPAF